MACRLRGGACLKRIPRSLTVQALLLSCMLAVIWTAVWLYLGVERGGAIRDGVERSTRLSPRLEENFGRAGTIPDTALLNPSTDYLADNGGFSVSSWMRNEPVLMRASGRLPIRTIAGDERFVADGYAESPVFAQYAPRAPGCFTGRLGAVANRVVG